MFGLFVFYKHCFKKTEITYFILYMVIRIILYNEKLIVLCIHQFPTAYTA